MNYQISVLMPSIRIYNLEHVYRSLESSFHGTWELVIVGPYPLPDGLKDKPNITYIEDWGNPIRGRQIGLLKSSGEYICYAADDVTFYPNSLDLAFEKINGKDYTDVVVGKYLESTEDNPVMKADGYYYLNFHRLLDPVTSRLLPTYKLLNTGLLTTKLLKEIGGWDCRNFEACAMACVDLSIRLQNYGANLIIQNEPIFHSSHLPGHAGDHAPIHDAQVDHDIPTFFALYSMEEPLKRTQIDVNNWVDTQKRWTRRFGDK
jgi:glycosyltransferase involved in cell wall biosynthesis